MLRAGFSVVVVAVVVAADAVSCRLEAWCVLAMALLPSHGLVVQGGSLLERVEGASHTAPITLTAPVTLAALVEPVAVTAPVAPAALVAPATLAAPVAPATLAAPVALTAPVALLTISLSLFLASTVL